MPIVTGTKNASIRAANIVMARAFFNRSKDWLYKKLTDAYTSSSAVEPHAVIGSAPPLELFNGRLRARTIPSFSMNVPNLLFKNVLKISQTDLEFDQTGTIMKLSQQMGVRLAEFPDMLFCKRLLNATASGSQNCTFNGVTYTMTFDGQPFFSASHSDWYSGGTQNNIIQGQLPSGGEASILAQDIAITANQMQRDVQAVIKAARTVKDNQGIPFFPTLSAKDNIVVVVPPILEVAASLAFKTSGTIGGSGGSSGASGSTTNIGQTFVKDVLTHGYLAGFRDPETGSTISPTNALDYYVFITTDYVKPFYIQNFKPLKNAGDFQNTGYNAEAEIDRLLKENSEIDVDAATAFASTRVDTTFNKIGANADEYTIVNDAFLISSRSRGNVTYGPWFTGWKIKPVSGS